ncbi:inactive protein kinase SELMODRAFT_444075 isoform X2 [Ricinus communis]|uniref:inactive protein kinase SELMODRAFT_444075 isoform X2 n=1 Tax=Ricinus communis TaxID=3988 RepID=UPI0007729E00|nr:inactive protein kinase SELMODRAFT_444075 isoform X2 [Ricinus communis]|eukprot:XP_015578732.1 inactive protein kinase SELMODRAFT_444075 isoform X2 [Ricinus communis]
MSLQDHPQRVVVIQDASKDVSPSAIRWLLDNFPFKPGDVLILFGVLHQVNNPMGYKVKVDSSSMVAMNPKFIAEEVARKTDEYSTNVEIKRIAKHCEEEQIEFNIEVRAGAAPKVVAIKAAKYLKATWIVLDRHLKRDKKYFIEKLQCGISRMKRDNTVEVLRGPKARVTTISPPERTIQTKSQVKYDEMIPGSPTKSGSSQNRRTSSSLGKEVQVDYSDKIPHQSSSKSTSLSKPSSSDQIMTASSSTSNLGYHEASGSSLTDARHSPFNYQDEDYTNTERETAGEQSPFSNAEGHQGSQKEVNAESPNEQLKQHRNNEGWMGGGPTDEMFNNSVCSICKNRRPRIGWKRDFTYAELHAATEGFSPKNFLSEGGFGSVYRGELGGLKIAVKQHKSASFQGEKEFKSEVNVLSRARNENLVMLLGSCSEGSQRLLVYEYVCNGSLDQHLSKHTRRPLSWEKRMKIALGAAKGLQYLHENSIIHRDMRPNNILITHDHEALLGDFGLARAQHDDSDHSWETRVVGTLGYLAPEYAECGKVSTKTDVYSFGIVLLQLITGLKTTDKILGGKSLVGWARPLLKEKNYPDLIDPGILDSHDVHQLFWMVRVAEKCLSKDPHKRLTMDKVVYALNHIMASDKACGIKDYSPAQSNSASSTPGSYDSRDDSTFTIGTTSISSISHISEKLPPSPPIGFSTSPLQLASSHFYRKITIPRTTV